MELGSESFLSCFFLAFFLVSDSHVSHDPKPLFSSHGSTLATRTSHGTRADFRSSKQLYRLGSKRKYSNDTSPSSFFMLFRFVSSASVAKTKANKSKRPNNSKNAERRPERVASRDTRGHEHVSHLGAD